MADKSVSYRSGEEKCVMYVYVETQVLLHSFIFDTFDWLLMIW